MAADRQHEVILFRGEIVDSDGPREPHIYTFNTEAESLAFIKGVVESHSGYSGYAFGHRSTDGSITDEEWEEVMGED